jgi:hypothetical protein
MYPFIELYEGSGMSQKQFCEEQHIVPHTFTYWLTKYRKSKRSKSIISEQNEFVALNISEPTEKLTKLRQIRITYPDGTLVELPV